MAVGNVNKQIGWLAIKSLTDSAQMVKFDAFGVALVVSKHRGLADPSLLSKPVARLSRPL